LLQLYCVDHLRAYQQVRFHTNSPKPLNEIHSPTNVLNFLDNISLRPAYLSLILGLALTEEISLAWLNASMLIRATPSVSAHSLTSPVGSDSLRKLVLLALALAGTANGSLQVILTIGGITGALLILLANLGARAWYFMRWKPLHYTGRGSFFIAFVLAVMTGVVLPYMGHRSIAVGGKGAMEYVIRTALIVAIVFVISDYDELQKFLVFGSESSEVSQQFSIESSTARLSVDSHQPLYAFACVSCATKIQ
jgi:hypothetical protein